jgi:hypothetical protein
MPSNSWANGWVTGDIPTAAEFAKGVGAIYDSVLGAPAASIDITGIVANYAHLEIEIYARGDTAATSTTILARFNNDSTAIYNTQNLQAANTTVTAAGALNAAQLTVGTMPAANAPVNHMGACRMLVPYYTGASGYKTMLGLSYFETADTAAGQAIYYTGGIWKSAVAINRITLLPGAGNFIAASRVTIYAKGA